MRLPQNLWYPVAESREVGRRPLGIERLGQRLVLWRTASGDIQAHPDRCPHLGAALSAGCVRNDRLICPFHGFAFEPSGKCVDIPAIGRRGRIPKAMALAILPVCEAHGFVWLWQGPAPACGKPPFFNLPADQWRAPRAIAVEWPVHYTRAIENQLDVAHLAFVHRTTIGAGGQSRVEGPHVEHDADRIKVWVSNVRDEGQDGRDLAALARDAREREPTLEFVFPGLWLLTISPRLKNLIAFVPIDDRRTLYYMRVYHRHRLKLIARPFELAMNLSNRFILSQDRRVVVTQTPNDSTAADDRLLRADLPIAIFRRELAKRLAQSAPDGTPDRPAL